MIEYVKNVKTGETASWLSADFAMKKWLLDNPPYWYWNFTTYGDSGYEKHVIYVYDGPILRDGSDKLCWEIHCSNERYVQSKLSVMERHLRDDMRYALSSRREGLGISEDTIRFILNNTPPTNYGSRSDAFDMYFKGYPKTELGYGVHSEVRCSQIRYPNGAWWDTYQNEHHFVKQDPTVEERVRWARRIDVGINLTMDTRDSPTKIIDRAVRIIEDPRLIALLKEIFEG